MAKRVALCPDWINAKGVSDIYSVSGCISKNFADYVKFWKHNGYWFFDSPQTILDVAQQNSIDLMGTTLFFYDANQPEFDGAEGEWTTFEPEASFKTEVVLPTEKKLEGYDVVTFSQGTSAEGSPLSCNPLSGASAINCC